MITWLERSLEAIAPQLALKRLSARERLRNYQAAYPSKYRSTPARSGSADLVMQSARTRLRDWARWLDENSQVAVAILDYHESSIIGPELTFEPMVRKKNGEPYERINKLLAMHFNEWSRNPTVTRDICFPELCRLAVRHWLRDGEIFTRHIEGDIDGLSMYPYALQMIPADYCPMDDIWSVQEVDVVQGVRKSGLGRPTGYIFYREHPNDIAWKRSNQALDTFEVAADNIIHLKFYRRMEQTRGVTILYPVITDLDDIKEVLDAERIAGTIAASNAFYIRKSEEFRYSDTASDEPRAFPIEPGMVWQNLFPGEEVGAVTSNRPNPELNEFIDGLLKRVCSATRSSYSYVTKQYDGSYSARRQERTENQRNANQLQVDFINNWVAPIRKRLIDILVRYGTVLLPRDVDPDTLYDVDIHVQKLPGLDPEKDRKAELYALQARTMSRHQIIRENGLVPAIVDQQIEADPLKPEANVDVQGDAFASPEVPEPGNTADKEQTDDDESEDEQAA